MYRKLSSRHNMLGSEVIGALGRVEEKVDEAWIREDSRELSTWMKRPLSPSHPPGSSACGSLPEDTGRGCPPEQRTKREKKHPSFTLCEVCNIQLNSAVQAQIHYNGKSHQKRLKQLSKGRILTSQVRKVFNLNA
ncbi:UNVERIFIED_CONTAM: hypothetical protein K2H54_015571 [Gekko kuhli]